MVAGEIKVVMTLDDGDFSVKTIKNGEVINEMKRSLDATAASTKNLENHFKTLAYQFESVVKFFAYTKYASSLLNDVFLALPVSILKTAGEIERMTKLMEGMSGAASDAGKKLEAASNVKFIFNMAQNAPFEVKALSDAFVKMKSAGLDPTNISMQALVDSVAKFGGTSDTMHRASIAIQQMAGKGVISMEELRQQLGEAVPNAINLMARGAGKSIAEFALLVKSGTVEATGSLNNMFVAMALANAGAASDMMNTWTGMLSLLKTKFALFQNDVANSQFFEAAKEQVQALTDSFDSRTAKRFAMDLGEGLATAVSTLRSLIDIVVEYGSVIKLAGEAFILYLGAKAIKASSEAFGKAFNSKISSYNNEIAKILEVRGVTTAAMTAEVAERTELAAVKEKMAVAEFKNAEASAVLVQKQIADIARLKAMSQSYLVDQGIANRLPRLAQDVAAEESARARAAAYRAEAISLALVSEAQARNAVAISAGLAPKAADLLLVKEATAANMLHAGSLEAASVASMNVANGLTLMNKATAAGQVVFQAFGGWVGIAIGVLALLGSKLYDYLNRWKEFDEIVKKTQNGLATKESNETLKKDMADLDKAIADKKAQLANMGSDTKIKEYDSKAGHFVQVDVKDQLAALLAQKAQAQKSFTDGVIQIEDEENNRYLTEYKRASERVSVQKMKADNNIVANVEKEKIDAIAKARTDKEASGKDFTTEDEKVIADGFQKQITALMKGTAQWNLAYVTSLRETIKTMAESEKDPAKKRLFEAQAAWTDEEFLKAARDLEEKSRKLGELAISKKAPNQKAEDPLVRMVEDTNAQVAQAKLKLEATVADLRGVAQLRNEAMVSVIGDMSSGRLDKSLGNGGNAGAATKRDYVGDIEARKKYTQDFVDYLKSGKTDIDAFVNSLDYLTDAQKKYVLQLVENRAELALIPQFQKAVVDAQMKGAQSQESLTLAKQRYNDVILSKADTAFLKEERHYAALEQKLKGLKDGYEGYTKAKMHDLANVASIDVYTTGLTAEQNLMKTNIEYNGMWQTMAEKRQAIYKTEIDLINQRADAEIANINKILASDKTSVEDRKELQKSLLKITETRQVATENQEKKLAIGSEIVLQKLARDWGDVTQQMNMVTGKWANTITDSLVELTTTGATDWRKMTTSMLTDLARIAVQKVMAGAVDSMFSAFKGLPALLGAQGGAVPGAADAVGVAPVNSMAAACTAATANITAFSTALGLGTTAKTAETTATEINTWAQEVDTVAKEAGTTIEVADTAVEEVAKDVETQDTVANVDAALAATNLAAALTAAAATAYFADGGIMTSAGSLPLNMYANGGVANTPQLAMFGEGKMPEAYVPLPDGRSIPVTMKGSNVATDKSNQGGSVVNISIAVASDGKSSSKSSGDETTAWTALATRVKAVVLEEMVKQKRPGGMNYQ